MSSFLHMASMQMDVDYIKIIQLFKALINHAFILHLHSFGLNADLQRKN